MNAIFYTLTAAQSWSVKSDEKCIICRINNFYCKGGGRPNCRAPVLNVLASEIHNDNANARTIEIHAASVCNVSTINYDDCDTQLAARKS